MSRCEHFKGGPALFVLQTTEYTVNNIPPFTYHSAYENVEG